MIVPMTIAIWKPNAMTKTLFQLAVLSSVESIVILSLAWRAAREELRARLHLATIAAKSNPLSMGFVNRRGSNSGLGRALFRADAIHE